MRHSHRKAHRLIWPLLAAALLAGVTMALILRPPPEKTALQAEVAERLA